MFELDYKNRGPIYEQVCDKIKELIAMGELKTGEQLPAVRGLAKEIGINHNTIQKAFGILEREGVIYTVIGKGSFVSEHSANAKIFKENALSEIKQTIEKNIIYKVTHDDIIKLSNSIFNKGVCEND